MLALISPAKTLDYNTVLPTETFTQPRLLTQSKHLINVCCKLSSTQVASLMGVSEKIAQLNVERFQDWNPEFDLANARQAIYAFKGDVYTGLNAYTLDQTQIEFAQTHLRMLSGLYGVLRPLDLMMPYRLEMGTKLNPYLGENLYSFWDDDITNIINQDLRKADAKILLNLASDEYYKSVKESKIEANVVRPVFLDQKNGQYKIISFYAKKARGLMARFVIDNQIKTIEQLKAFKVDGYYFDEINSNEKEIVFKRDEKEA